MIIKYHEVSLQRVVEHWAKDYQGNGVVFSDAFVDVGKGVVVFKLYVDEVKEEKHDS